jgi:hypothetical protein
MLSRGTTMPLETSENNSMRFYLLMLALSIVWSAADLVSRANAAPPVETPEIESTPPSEQTVRRTKLAATIDTRLDEARALADVAQRLPLLRQAVEATRTEAAFNPVVTTQLSEAATRSEQMLAESPEKAANVLRDALRAARDLLKFEPAQEAPLPAGFPEPMPAGEIGIKRYPAYRLARAKDGDEGRAFNQLFKHIQRNNIEMTAPVEMTFEKSAAGEMRSLDMAFLYQSTSLGKPGLDAKINVLDVEPMITVSIGVRGSTERARIAAAEAQLQTWLKAHATEFEATGPVRVMGYNSPFVPEFLRYFEVELPVKELTKKAP